MATPGQPAFGVGDWIQHFPLIGEPKSGLLIPPVPDLVLAGLRPFYALPSTLALRDWVNPDELRAAGSFGFLQAVSLHPAEYERVASTGDGFRFFLDHLLPSDEEYARGCSSGFKILDMDRASAL